MQPDQGNRSSRALIYLVLVVVTLFCLCAAVNVFVYGAPNIGQSPSVLRLDTTVLAAISLLIVSFNNIISDVIANWVCGRIDILPSRVRSITRTIIVIIFLILLILSVLFAVILK